MLLTGLHTVTGWHDRTMLLHQVRQTANPFLLSATFTSVEVEVDDHLRVEMDRERTLYVQVVRSAPACKDVMMLQDSMSLRLHTANVGGIRLYKAFLSGCY